MAMSSERHNRLATEFVQKVVREAGGFPEMMVVVESMLLASMAALNRIHGCDPATSVALIDEAVQSATERFAKGNR